MDGCKHFLNFIEHKLKEIDGDVKKLDASPVLKEMSRLGVEKETATLILAQVFFTADKASVMAKEGRSLFLRFCHKQPKSQRYLMLSLSS